MSEVDGHNGPLISTGAFEELRINLDYARDLVRGGRYLQHLEVGAFEVEDLYRAAWVQAVSALDHWLHRELYDRALGFALEPSAPRPSRFLRVEVPMGLVEDVLNRKVRMEEAFLAELHRQFGYQSFQAPEKIKQALGIVSDASLWPSVAKELAHRSAPGSIDAEQVQVRLRQIVQRRNRIAHQADRDPSRDRRSFISDAEATETVDWIGQLAEAILVVLGPPPTGNDTGEATGLGASRRTRWTRQDIEAALDRMDDVRVVQAVRTLLRHADTHAALFKGGAGSDPSAGLQYLLHGKRRSLWTLYLSAVRPSVSLNFGVLWPRHQELARNMLREVRHDPSLDAALLHSDDDVIRKYPAISLAILAESSPSLDTVIRALDVVVQSDSPPSR